LDLDDVGAEPLISELNIDTALAEKLLAAAAEEAKSLAAAAKQNRAENIMQQQGETTDNE